MLRMGNLVNGHGRQNQEFQLHILFLCDQSKNVYKLQQSHSPGQQRDPAVMTGWVASYSERQWTEDDEPEEHSTADL